MSNLADEIYDEYQRLAGLGEYSDAAKVQIRTMCWLAELAKRVEALERKLGPLGEAMERSAVVDEGRVAGLKLP